LLVAVSNKTILIVSTVESIRSTRQLILQQAGYSVTAVGEWHELETACASLGYDLVILGQSLTPSFKRDAAAFLKAHCPNSAILEIYVVSPVLNDGTNTFRASSPLDPRELIRAVAQALGESSEQASGS
jgi:DNA-binding NtrC family response regulator